MNTAVTGPWKFARRTRLSTYAIFAATIYLIIKNPTDFLTSWLCFAMIGLACEAVFTGIGNQLIRRKEGKPVDWVLKCEPYLWSVIVYGLSAALSLHGTNMLWPGVFKLFVFARCFLFMVLIYFWEFYWGWQIEHWIGVCPWKYKESPYKIWRYINPSYFWSWYLFAFALDAMRLYFFPAILDHAIPELIRDWHAFFKGLGL